MGGGPCRPRDEGGFLPSAFLWDTPGIVRFSSSSSWLCPTCCQEGGGSDLLGALVPEGNRDGCSCHTALGHFSLVWLCLFWTFQS